jgi:hypothetical protein
MSFPLSFALATTDLDAANISSAESPKADGEHIVIATSAIVVTWRSFMTRLYNTMQTTSHIWIYLRHARSFND